MKEKNKETLTIDDIIANIKNVNPDANVGIENIIKSGNATNMMHVIDNLFIKYGVGPIKSGITRSLYGVNFASVRSLMPINKDNYGFTFFTRPCMNMTTDNLRSNRIMSQLLNTDEKSIHRLIRTYLDPQRIPVDYRQFKPSPFVNDDSPFIPLLSNNLISMSGWPDYDAQTYTSGAGNYREEYSFVDGILKDYRVFDLTCSFRNLDGNVILNLFYYWLLYEALVAMGDELVPYPEMNVFHEIDYNTAIWRITLDEQKEYITGIARTIAYPITCPIGAMFNFEFDRVYNDENDQTSIQFKCHGAEYNDDILVDEFNRLVELFDPSFRGGNKVNNFKLLPLHMYKIYNGLAVPRINPVNYKLEWWVSNDDYYHYLDLVDKHDSTER